jgi:hypothetical protein
MKGKGYPERLARKLNNIAPLGDILNAFALVFFMDQF